jgi:peptidase M50-like protein
MYGPDSGREPDTSFERWFSALFLLGMLGLFAAVIVVDYQPVKLVPAFFALAWFVLLPIHEAGHAVTAHLLGWRVGEVVIGMGRALHRFRLGKTVVEVRMFPIEGFCATVPTNMDAPRLKSALIYFAGPGVEILILAMLVLAVGLEPLTSHTEQVGMLACQGLAIAILASVVFNLVPHYAVSQHGMVPNDGLGIIQSFFKPDSHYLAMIGRSFDADWQAPEERRDDEDDYDGW